MDKRIGNEDIAWYTLTTPMLQKYLAKEGVRVWVAEIRVLLDVLVGWIVALLNLDGAYDYKLWTPRSVGRIKITEMRCVA